MRLRIRTGTLFWLVFCLLKDEVAAVLLYSLLQKVSVEVTVVKTNSVQLDDDFNQKRHSSYSINKYLQIFVRSYFLDMFLEQNSSIGFLFPPRSIAYLV